MNIRSYTTGDEKQIWELDRKLEAHPWNRRALNNWYWKYTENNPSGRSFIWLMEKDESIIAHFAAVPYRLKVFDEELTVTHSIGALVEQKYQNLGLLKFVGDKLFEQLKGEDIYFTYGFPNKRAYNLHKSFMGYSDLIFFDTWEIKQIPQENVSQQLFFRKIDKFEDDVDALWRRCAKDYKIAVVRDKKYLNWRYLQRPDCEYFPFGVYQENVLKGYIVLKLYREEKTLRGHILDVFGKFDDKDTFNRMIDGSLEFFHAREVDEITCWIWGQPLFEKLLAERNFIKKDTKVPLIIRINKEFKYSMQAQDNKNWYFTMGDSTEIF